MVETIEWNNNQWGTTSTTNVVTNGDVNLDHDEGTTESNNVDWPYRMEVPDDKAGTARVKIIDDDTSNTVREEDITGEYQSGFDRVADGELTFDLYDHWDLTAEAYVDVSNQGDSDETEYVTSKLTDHNGVQLVYEERNTTGSDTDTANKNYRNELPYYDSGSWSSTKSFNGTRFPTEARVDTTINANESIDITFTDDNSNSVTQSLSNGDNTVDLSGFDATSALDVSVSFSNSSTDDTPQVNQIEADGQGAVQVYDGTAFVWAPVSAETGSGFTKPVVKYYDSGSGSWQG